MIHRTLEDNIQPLLLSEKAIIIIGARQVGFFRVGQQIKRTTYRA